jgi:hypothetical protein
MRVLITALLLMLAVPVSAADFDDWHRAAFKVFSRLEEKRDAVRGYDCSSADNVGVCEETIQSFSERIDLMIGRVKAVATSDDLTDSKGNVVDDSHALCDEIELYIP